MSPTDRLKLIRSIRAIHKKAEQALKKAVAETIRDHAKTGDPIVIWQDGKVVRVPAAQTPARHSRKRQ